MRPIRNKARVLLLDSRDAVLLLRVRATSISGVELPDRGETLLLLPGGGVEDGETYEQAAIREMAEETGIVGVPLGPLAFVRDRVHIVDDQEVYSHDRFFTARVPDGIVIDSSGTTDHERANSLGHQWFTADELAEQEARENVLPLGLAKNFRRYLETGTTIDIS
jgi:ADP-ribose pyrophosphatase YjhB (NUDIX family)